MKQIVFKEMKQIPKDLSAIEDASIRRYTPILSKDREDIESIIENMINIQAILARHYLYKREFGFSNSIDSTLILTNNISQEIEMFAAVFDEVIITERIDGIPINIQVSSANDLAYEVFEKMIHENKIDKYIKHFSVERHFKKDFSEKSFFEINKNESKIVKNRYFDYLISGSISPNILNPLYIDVSAFNIDEIENDKYVQQLAAQVNHLYLMVIRNETSDISFYSKQLRWYI